MTIAAQAMKINLRLVLPPLLVLNALATPANAGRGLGASEQGATVFLVKTVAPSMKLVDAQIRYNDGDILAGLFKINCKTQKILPTNYRLLNKNGLLKKSGKAWDVAFSPKWKGESELVDYACSVSDF